MRSPGHDHHNQARDQHDTPADQHLTPSRTTLLTTRNSAPDLNAYRALMADLQTLLPDLHVEVVDSLAEGDKVTVRNVWTGTHAETGKRMEFHGFVLWRLAGGKIVERWATVTPLAELSTDTLEW
jgi:predicted ester cyclase